MLQKTSHFMREANLIGGAWVLSSATGRELLHWKGTDRRGGFGGVLAAAADLDGDGKGEIVVAAPATEDQKRTLPGELVIYSSASGGELQRWRAGMALRPAMTLA